MWSFLWAILPFALLMWLVWWAAQPESDQTLRYLHPDYKPPTPRRREVDPTKKSPAMEAFLEANFGRSTAIEANTCVKPPFGCGKPIEGFRDERSVREYRISGLCQTCQDEVFSPPEEEDDLV